MNREERRKLKNTVAPIAKEIAKLELKAQNPETHDEAIAEIDALLSKLSIMEMMAVEDYIMSKGLLKNNFADSNNK